MNFDFHPRLIVRFFVLFFLFPAFPLHGQTVRQVPDAAYADPASCAECHAELCDHWSKSDHAHSMDHANEKSVLGDFGDVSYLHVGFDDLLLLSDAELRILLDLVFQAPSRFDPKKEYAEKNESQQKDSRRYDILGRKAKPVLAASFDDFALSTFDTKPGVVEKLRRNMSAEQVAEFDADLEFRKSIRVNRPGDIATAQARIGDVVRRLIGGGKIETKIGTRFRMFRQGDKFMVETDLGPYEILFTLGNRPLQQYLVSTEGGRLQALPVAWDSVDNRWFHLYPKEQIPKNDPLHWTKSLQNWNRMCSDCHTTNLWRHFDADKVEYRTTFSEINVGCQACHGPCGKHVETARKQGFKTDWKEGIPKDVFLLSEATDRESVDSCAFCHARRRLLREGPKPPETPAVNWFVPELLDANVYYSDGQLLEESFEMGSFLQSKMFSKGVRCTNCHEPHTLNLRFEGNRLCTQCHSPSIYDTVKHHFHPDASKPGTACMECHFPQSTYMVVDPRRDHSIRKPSPALTLSAGVPNACTLCHQDRRKGETVEWARDKVDFWYAEKRKSAVGYSDLWPTAEHYAQAIAEGRRGDPVAVPKLMKLISEKNEREFRAAVRAGALSLLGRFPRPDILPSIREGLFDADPLIRLAAVGAMGMQADDDKLTLLPSLLHDPTLAVRTETARILAPLARRLPKRIMETEFDTAKREYIDSQLVNADQGASWLNLGVLEHDLAEPQLLEIQRWLAATLREIPPESPETAKARQTAETLIRKLTDMSLEQYRRATRIDADFFPARINLAMLYNERGELKSAESEFREALKIAPEDGNANYSLALLLTEQNRNEEAVPMFRKAAELLPENRRIRYNLGLLLLQLGRAGEAEKELSGIVEAEPRNLDFLNALAYFYHLRGNEKKLREIQNRIQEAVKTP